MNIEIDAADNKIETIRERIIASAMRCIRMQLIALGRDWERCGKASCARTRRCRGFACEPEVGDDDDA
jgi:hypothetical protein